MSRIAFARTEDRKKGVRISLQGLAVNPVRGKEVLTKPNFNTAHPVPGSTHNHTLVALVEKLWAIGARTITLGERGYGSTRNVMEQKGIIPLMEQRDVKIIDFDQLDESDWVKFEPRNSHWTNGFRIARPIVCLTLIAAYLAVFLTRLGC